MKAEIFRYWSFQHYLQIVKKWTKPDRWGCQNPKILDDLTWNYPISKYYSKKFVWSELIVELIPWKNVMKNKKRIYQKVNRKTKYAWAEEDLENTAWSIISSRNLISWCSKKVWNQSINIKILVKESKSQWITS